MAPFPAVLALQVPRIEDEIARAYEKFQQQADRQDDPLDHRMIFEAGFRAARTSHACSEITSHPGFATFENVRL